MLVKVPRFRFLAKSTQVASLKDIFIKFVTTSSLRTTRCDYDETICNYDVIRCN
jgi:hypothetical protein